MKKGSDAPGNVVQYENTRTITTTAKRKKITLFLSSLFSFHLFFCWRVCWTSGTYRHTHICCQRKKVLIAWQLLCFLSYFFIFSYFWRQFYFMTRRHKRRQRPHQKKQQEEDEKYRRQRTKLLFDFYFISWNCIASFDSDRATDTSRNQRSNLTHSSLLRRVLCGGLGVFNSFRVRIFLVLKILVCSLVANCYCVQNAIRFNCNLKPWFSVRQIVLFDGTDVKSTTT